MGLPKANDSRLYYRAAFQRYADAEFLLANKRTTGAVYLAGYGVECILKALILSVVGGNARREMLASFRGARAHDFGWLKFQYVRNGGTSYGAPIARHFATVNRWSTDMRYVTGTLRQREAEAFLKAAAEIIKWAEGRL